MGKVAIAVVTGVMLIANPGWVGASPGVHGRDDPDRVHGSGIRRHRGHGLPGGWHLSAAVNLAGDGGTGSDHLAIVDKNTGAATVVGPFGSCTGVSIPTQGNGSCTIEGAERPAST